MGQTALRNLFKKIKEVKHLWLSIIADEATDVVNTEQLTLTIRRVRSDYRVQDDSVGLFRVPNTRAETLFMVIKDLLIRCGFHLASCRGQAYDGVATIRDVYQVLLQGLRN